MGGDDMRAYLKSHGLIYSRVKVQPDPLNRMSRATKEKNNRDLSLS